MITVSLYANRRLYSSIEARYITLADIIEYVEKDIKFTVIHFDTKKDITSQTLVKALIWLERDLPCSTLIDLIKNASSEKGKSTALNMLSFAKTTAAEKKEGMTYSHVGRKI